MKYKVGDKVRIRRDLMIFEKYGSQTFVKQMEKYKGMPATTSEVFSDTYYIKEDKGENWYWTDDMFEAGQKDPFEFKPVDNDNSDLQTYIMTDNKKDMEYIVVTGWTYGQGQSVAITPRLNKNK